MKQRTKSCFLVIIFFLIASILPFSSTQQTAQAFTASDADDAMNALINVYWDSNKQYFYTNSDQQIHTHAHGPENGLYTDFWWEAQMWETVMDAYERTSSSQYEQMIHDVYDGFVSYYPNFSNNFNDDLGWWALASTRAYQLTNDTTYKDTAIQLFQDMWNYWDSTYGGGIWWKRDGTDPQKNMATNAPALETAVNLYTITGESAYLVKAEQIYNWIESRLVGSNGYVYDHIEGTGSGTVVAWDFTYNFGTYAGASLAMYKVTQDPAYLSNAVNALDWVIDNMTLDGTLLHEGVNDGGGFKMVFTRNMNKLIQEAGQTQYVSFLQHNATQAWNHRRMSGGIIGPDWTAPAPNTYIQSLTAAAGASLLQMVAPDGYQGTVEGIGRFEAENARKNIISESSESGFTGRGYLAGWNNNGQEVVFHVNVVQSGTYELSFHYAGGAGNASRYLEVNGVSANSNLSFPNTGSWGNWSNVYASVHLDSGHNTVRLAYDSNAGSSNYINLDHMHIDQSVTNAQYEAEDGNLYNLTSENSHSGYTGTGYVAGWHTDGQWVDINVDAPSAGNYTVQFRYASGAGDASRYLYINGAGIVNNLVFSDTGSWNSYNTIHVSNVYLNEGSNTVSLIFNSSLGSNNWLNYDHLTIEAQ